MAVDYLKDWGYSVDWDAVDRLEDERERNFAKSMIKYMQKTPPSGFITGQMLLNARDWYSEYVREYELPDETFLINPNSSGSEMECVNCHELFKRMSKDKQACVYFIKEALSFIDVYGKSTKRIVKGMDYNEKVLLRTIITETLSGKQRIGDVDNG